MNFLNREQYLKHMDPSNNYLEKEVVRESEPVLEIEEANDIETPSTPSLVIVDKPGLGKGKGNPNVPDFLRKTVAELANTPGVKGTDIAQSFGLSQATVTHAKHGRTFQGSDVKPELKEIVDAKRNEVLENRSKIEDEALNKVLQTLGVLTQDDIECLGAKDKADVAVKLAKVAETIRSKKESENDNRVQIIIHAPQVKQDVHYDTIDV